MWHNLNPFKYGGASYSATDTNKLFFYLFKGAKHI